MTTENTGEKLRSLLYNLWASSEMDTQHEGELHEARLAANALIAENKRLAQDLDDTVEAIALSGRCQAELISQRDYYQLRAELAEGTAARRTKERNRARADVVAVGLRHKPNCNTNLNLFICNCDAQARLDAVLADEPEVP